MVPIAIGIFVYLFNKIRNFRVKKRQVGIFIPKRLLKAAKYKKLSKKIGFIQGWRSEYVCFDSREEMLYNALKQGQNIRIVEEAGRGKTRTTLEVIKKLVKEKHFNDILLIFITHKSKFEYRFLHKKYFLKKHQHIILFFDDIDKIIPEIRKNGMRIWTIIHDFKNIAYKVQCICTCRKERWGLAETSILDMTAFLEVRARLKSIFKIPISLSRLTIEEGHILADKFPDLSFPDNFTGNASDIVLQTIVKRTEYDVLGHDQKRILHSVKICRIANINDPSMEIVGQYAVQEFNVEEWKTHCYNLRDAEFFDIINEHIHINDVYLEEVIHDFPPMNPHKYHGLQKHLISLMDILEKENAIREINSLAYKFKELGLFEQALRCLNIVIKFEPKNFGHYNNRGLIHNALKDFKKAIEDFKKAIDLKPQHIQAHYNLGNTHSKLGRYDLAIVEYKKALEIDSNLADASNNLGIIYNSLSNYKMALKHFDNAISRDSAYLSSYYNRGNTYAKLDKYTEALKDYAKVIELDPGFAQAYNNRGNTYAKLHKYTEALKDYAKAIELDPEDAKTYNNRGNTYAKLHKHTEALKDYAKVIELSDVRDTENFLTRAIQAYEETLKIYTIDNYPLDYAKTMNSLGTAYLNLSDVQDKENFLARAIQAYEETLNIYTIDNYPLDYAKTMHNYGSAYLNLSDIRDKEDNLTRAFQAYEEVWKIYTIDNYPIQYAMTMNSLGTAYLNLSDIRDKEDNLTRAFQAYEEALKIYTINNYPIQYAMTMNSLGTAYLNLSDIRDKEDNLTRAFQAYEEVLKIYTIDNYPLDYAMTMYNLGLTFWKLAKECDKKLNCMKADKAFQNALKIFTVDTFPDYNKSTNESLKVLSEFCQNYKD